MNRRLVAVVAVGLVAAGGVLAHELWLRAYRRGEAPRLPLGRDGVVFIITDNVRADHTGLCGYERTTTPTLSSLSVAPGVVHTCRAYAPGSWTLPSHASYFTGKTTLEHGAHEYAGAVSDPSGTRIVSHSLADSEETLAETMRADGYQTVLMAGNPVVGRGMGLSQGYAHVRTAKKFGDLDYPELTEELSQILRERLDPVGGPLLR